MDDFKGVQVWRKKAWTNCYSLYARLLQYLIQDLNFTCNFASLIDPSEIDVCAKFMVNIFTATGHALPLINALVSREFSKVGSEGEGSILRGNNLINKIEGVYLRTIGGNYLRIVLGDLVTKIVTDKDMNLEVDPRKVNIIEDDYPPIKDLSIASKMVLGEVLNAEDAAEKNVIKLKEMAQAFLDRITDPKMVEEMPKEMRTIAAFTAEYAKKHAPDSIAPLIGGFIMLRFFTPAIATPETSKLVNPEVVPSARAKRNLVLLAKVLQNASNGVLFGGKEAYMTCMNDFIADNKTKINKYFMDVVSQPASGPLLPEDSIRKSGGSSRSLVRNVSKTPGATNIDETITDAVSQLDLQDLFDLHRVLDQTKEKLINKYKKMEPPPTGPCAFQEQIFGVLRDLGPSPKTKTAKKKEAEGEREPVAVVPDQSVMFEGVMQVLENARFLYAGPKDKHDRPVFYIIVNRIKVDFLENINPLVSHIFKVMDSAVNAPYSIVIDMSWANMSAEFKRAVYTHLPKLSKIFSRKYKKNVHSIFIVHPSAYTRAVIHFMRFFTSRKLTRKFHEIYNWKQLTTEIDAENILLPDTSKDFITKSYRVIKVNAKGKKQERLIKFTPSSLLNIDPKTKKIQNEKRIDEIEEISSFPGSLEISMRFTPESSATKKRGSMFSSKEDLAFRRYICPNLLQRDNILQDIFETGFKSFWMKPPPDFNVIKVNQAGKHQERIFKLTIDSLLNLDHKSVKSETSFAGMEDAVLDPTEPDVLWMKLKAETFKRKIICRGQAKELVQVLTEGLTRYKQNFQNEEDEAEKEGDDEYNTLGAAHQS